MDKASFLAPRLSFLEKHNLGKHQNDPLLRSNFNVSEINSRETYRFLDHNSEPCRNFWTILRHKLPIIHLDLPIPFNNLNSNVQPEFLNPKSLYKTDKTSRVLAAERRNSFSKSLILQSVSLSLIHI